MKFIDRHFPLLSWIPKAKEAGMIPEGHFSRVSQTKAAEKFWIPPTNHNIETEHHDHKSSVALISKKAWII